MGSNFSAMKTIASTYPGSCSAFISALIMSLLIVAPASGQNNKELLQDLLEEDRSAVEALVMYPESTRKSILELSTHPELLIKLDGLQRKTKEKFIAIVEEYEQEDQAKYYELMRFPGLLDALVEGEQKSKKAIEEILKAYPEEVHETATELGRKKYKDLEVIYELNQTVKSAFQEIISSYPEETQAATRELAGLPETLSLLTENMNLTILIGDLYKTDPDWVFMKADSLNLALARQNAEELEDYKKQLEEDPDAYKEMVEAAEQYAKDNGLEEDMKKEPAVEHTTHVVHHYPYWYGYPYWYASPVWAPVPWYYHTGFYFGPGGAAVFIGFPSSFYVGWHYRYYPNRYVHLNTHYHRHYYRHPHSHSSFHRSVNVNVNRNTNIRVNKRYDNTNRQGNIGNNKNRNPNVERNRQGNIGNNKPRNPNVDRNRTGNMGQQRATSRQGSYDRHRAYDNHRQSWNSRSSGRSYNRPSPSRSGGRRRF